MNILGTRIRHQRSSTMLRKTYGGGINLSVRYLCQQSAGLANPFPFPCYSRAITMLNWGGMFRKTRADVGVVLIRGRAKD